MSQPLDHTAWTFEEVHMMAFLLKLEQNGECGQVATLVLANKNQEAKALTRVFFDRSIGNRLKQLAPAK